MRFAISAIAIVAVTFSATLAFAPAIAGVGQRLSFSQFLTAPATAPVEIAKVERDCFTPVAKIADALGNKDCV